MLPALAHIESLAPNDAAVARMIGGMTEFLTGVQEKFVDCAQEKEQYRQKAEIQTVEPVNVVADGMQGELIAIANALYARGMFTCSKKELMERLGGAFGCPGLADYSRTLNKIKQTNKYADIFDDVKKVAILERDKND